MSPKLRAQLAFLFLAEAEALRDKPMKKRGDLSEARRLKGIADLLIEQAMIEGFKGGNHAAFED